MSYRAFKRLLGETSLERKCRLLTRESQCEDPFERDLFKEFKKAEDARPEVTRPRSGERVLLYYAPIRANTKCLACHQRGPEKLAENDLMAVVRIRMSTKPI